MSIGGEGAHPLYWLDVFTDRPLAGNGLAVVLDADGISEETMLAFAREVKLSETTFVQSATEDGADYRNRIWTISDEIPFAGHPSLGTAVAMAVEEGSEEASYVQQTVVGHQTVDVEMADEASGSVWHASILQEPAEFLETFPASRVAPALGISEDGVDAQLSSQLVTTGLPTLLVPLASEEALASCRPDFDRLRKLDPDQALNLYAFHFDVPARRVSARGFAADMGEVEDPATGSAAGPLIAYLQDCLDIDRVTIDQGAQMGRPSRLEAKMESGRPRVSGDVTVLSVGRVRLP